MAYQSDRLEEVLNRIRTQLLANADQIEHRINTIMCQLQHDIASGRIIRQEHDQKFYDASVLIMEALVMEMIKVPLRRQMGILKEVRDTLRGASKQIISTPLGNVEPTNPINPKTKE